MSLPYSPPLNKAGLNNKENDRFCGPTPCNSPAVLLPSKTKSTMNNSNLPTLKSIQGDIDFLRKIIADKHGEMCVLCIHHIVLFLHLPSAIFCVVSLSLNIRTYLHHLVIYIDTTDSDLSNLKNHVEFTVAHVTKEISDLNASLIERETANMRAMNSFMESEVKKERERTEKAMREMRRETRMVYMGLLTLTTGLGIVCCYLLKPSLLSR